MLFERPLKIQDFFLTLSVIYQEIFGLLLTGVSASVGLRLKSESFNLTAELLGLCIPNSDLKLFALLDASVVQPLSVVCSGLSRHRWAAGCRTMPRLWVIMVNRVSLRRRSPVRK